MPTCKAGASAAFWAPKGARQSRLALRRARLAFAALALAGLTGCGATYQPGRGAAFEMDAAAHIDDEDIRKAYEVRPQLPAEMRVAYYTFVPAAAKDLEAAIRALP